MGSPRRVLLWRVSRHLYKQIGKKFLGKEFIPRFANREALHIKGYRKPVQYIKRELLIVFEDSAQHILQPLFLPN